MDTAKLTVERAAAIAAVDKRLYGSFLEQLGRAVYNGVYQPGHPAADANGFRRDVLGLVRELDVPVVRYPGGNYVSGHRWEDGIGPRGKRPRRLDLAWFAIDTNQFGVDEFCAWAREAGTEPLMSVNLGTRGAQEAADLVEYCNFPGGTYLSDLRRANGAEQPHGIKTWCLGNEMDGPWQIGSKTAEEYGRLACETAKMMKWVDPTIDLVACGSSGYGMSTFGAWERTVLEHCYDHVDYISLHTYYGERNDPQSFLLLPERDMEPFIESVAAICDGVRARRKTNKTIGLSFDEWNVWNNTADRSPDPPRWTEHPHQVENVYTVLDAVVVGGMLIALLRHCDRIKIACLAQLVNVIAPIMTEDDGGAWRQTIYYPFLHASRYGRGEAIRVAIDSPKLPGEAGDSACVDAVAVDNGDELTVFAVNRSLTDAVPVALDLRDYGAVRPLAHIIYTSGDLHAHNGPDEAQNVVPYEAADLAAPILPPCSWNVLRFAKS